MATKGAAAARPGVLWLSSREPAFVPVANQQLFNEQQTSLFFGLFDASCKFQVGGLETIEAHRHGEGKKVSARDRIRKEGEGGKGDRVSARDALRQSGGETRTSDAG